MTTFIQTQRDALVDISSRLSCLEVDFCGDQEDAKDWEFHHNLWYYYLYPEDLNELDSFEVAKYQDKIERCGRLECYWRFISGLVGEMSLGQ
jgi:hypothetical protein